MKGEQKSPLAKRVLERMWLRFVDAVAAENTQLLGKLANIDTHVGRVNSLRYWLCRGAPGGFSVESAFEASMLGLEAPELRAAAASSARPGTREKVKVLARRYLAGQELHDAADLRLADDGCDDARCLQELTHFSERRPMLPGDRS